MNPEEQLLYNKMDEKIDALKDDLLREMQGIKDSLNSMDRRFAAKPAEWIAYGLAGIILTSVAYAVVAIVVPEKAHATFDFFNSIL